MNYQRVFEGIVGKTIDASVIAGAGRDQDAPIVYIGRDRMDEVVGMVTEMRDLYSQAGSKRLAEHFSGAVEEILYASDRNILNRFNAGVDWLIINMWERHFYDSKNNQN
ncbi:hypothetical protein HOA92_04640 [archaeon]|jgi:hypothetical protein|nr:hypothetical protein [archaeon]MBT6762304.1 hypothetical protein [archaeon]